MADKHDSVDRHDPPGRDPDLRDEWLLHQERVVDGTRRKRLRGTDDKSDAVVTAKQKRRRES